MKKLIALEQKAWVLAVSNWLIEKQKSYRAKSLYLPAGDTPKLIYQQWEQEKFSLLNKLKMIQLDDVLSGPKKDLFKNFFYQELPSFADQIEYFDRGESQADLGILGIGLNGHVAFHEPGLHPGFYSGCVLLREETRRNLALEDPSWGKTYGVGAFLRCKALLMIVKGIEKKNILQKTLQLSAPIPASALLIHPDLTILSDFEF